MRREPEGIEHDAGDSKTHQEENTGMTIRGSYDHSQEYDPYQSAAKQMQELLFGNSVSASSSASNAAAAHLRPSTNSAFQKYVPGNDIPSTADINSKFGGVGFGASSAAVQSAKARMDSYSALSSAGRRESSTYDGAGRGKLIKILY